MRLAQLLQTMSKYHLGLLLSLESMAKTLVPLGPWSAQGASIPCLSELGRHWRQLCGFGDATSASGLWTVGGDQPNSHNKADSETKSRQQVQAG